jgi:preprotein translocase subunit SecA
MLEKLLKLFKSEAGLTRIVKDINALEPELIKLSDQSIKERGRQLR